MFDWMRCEGRRALELEEEDEDTKDAIDGEDAGRSRLIMCVKSIREKKKIRREKKGEKRRKRGRKR